MIGTTRVIAAGVVAAVAAAGGTWAFATSTMGRAATGIEERIAALAAEQKQREEELGQTRQKIDMISQEVQVAQAELEYHRCEARNAGIMAAARTAFAEYMRDVALFERCVAANEARKSNDTLFGAVLGLGLAAATGGGSLLLAGAGAVAGAAGSESQVCPPKPPEVRQEADFLVDALKRERMAALPVCQRPTGASP